MISGSVRDRLRLQEDNFRLRLRHRNKFMFRLIQRDGFSLGQIYRFTHTSIFRLSSGSIREIS